MKHKRLLIPIFCCWSLVLGAQDSLTSVIAEPGDGIFSLLRKNGLDPTKHHEAFLKINADLVADRQRLIAGHAYLLPHLPKKEVNNEAFFPLFGEDHAKFEIVDESLLGAVYYLISGHGGPDPGAVVEVEGQLVSEDEYAYDVTIRLARELMAKGAKVYLIVQDSNDGIRDFKVLPVDYDETVDSAPIPLSQRARLQQRTDYVNQLYQNHLGQYQRLVVTHIDSRGTGDAIDVFFYYHQKSQNGQRLARHIHQTFQEKYQKFQPKRVYTGTFSERSDLYLVKKTKPAMAYIEIGNIRNQKDQKRIFDSENRQALAKWIAEGLALDFAYTTSKLAK